MTEGGTVAQSIGSLISQAVTSGRRLVEAQVTLTRTELSETGKQVGAISVLALAAVSTASIAGLFLLIAAAYGLVAAGLPVWAGFLIVAVVLLAITGILGLVAKSKAEKMNGPKVAAEELQATTSAVERALGQN